MLDNSAYSDMSKKEKMHALRDMGLKYQDIAEMLGVSRQYVSAVCSKRNPAYFAPIDEKCIYPNLRNWMNENKVTRKEFLFRMGITVSGENYNRFGAYLRGENYPRKPYIDKMLEITGMTYETMFYTEEDDG